MTNKSLKFQCYKRLGNIGNVIQNFHENVPDLCQHQTVIIIIKKPE